MLCRAASFASNAEGAASPTISSRDAGREAITANASTLPSSMPWSPSKTSTIGRSAATVRSTPRSACTA
jgi:hypothetical protein